MAETQAVFGRIDVLVNNAALTAMSNIGFAPVPDLPVDEWRRVIDVNLSSAYYASRAAGRIMREQRSGTIINISSVHAHVPNALTPHYDATKAGLEALTRNLALYFGRFGVRVNTVAPGPIVEEGGESAGTLFARGAGESAPRHRARPIGRPAEVAAVVAFLASAEASYMTGSTSSSMVGSSSATPGCRMAPRVSSGARAERVSLDNAVPRSRYGYRRSRNHKGEPA